MSLTLTDLFHGAVIAKITRNKENKLSLIEWDPDDNRAIYNVTSGKKDFDVLVKYDSTARKTKTPKELKWDFATIQYKKGRYYALTCIQSKRISSRSVMEVCLITPDNADKIFTQTEKNKKDYISCVISLSPRKQFRVTRKHQNISITVPRNAIEKV